MNCSLPNDAECLMTCGDGHVVIAQVTTAT